MNTSNFCKALHQALDSQGISVGTCNEVEVLKPNQVRELETKVAVSLGMTAPHSMELQFELHVGSYNGVPSAYLRAQNAVEHSWEMVQFAGSVDEVVQTSVERVVKNFVLPLSSQSSLPPEAFDLLRNAVLPYSIQPSIEELYGERLCLRSRVDGTLLGSYLFRGYELYSSFFDANFDPSLMHLKHVTTHYLSDYYKLQFSPIEWAQLVRAWISRSIFYSFGYLEENDYLFLRFGKELSKLPRGLPAKLRSMDTGLSNWITRSEVAARTKDRSKFVYQEDN